MQKITISHVSSATTRRTREASLFPLLRETTCSDWLSGPSPTNRNAPGSSGLLTTHHTLNWSSVSILDWASAPDTTPLPAMQHVLVPELRVSSPEPNESLHLFHPTSTARLLTASVSPVLLVPARTGSSCRSSAATGTRRASASMQPRTVKQSCAH